MNFTTITDSIAKSDPLDFGSIFSRSMELFKKVRVQGFITVLLTFATILPFYLLVYIPLIAAGITDPEMLESDDVPPVVMVSMMVLMPILFLAIIVISLSLNAAFLRICRLKDLNEVGADGYFFYFKKKYLGKTILLALILLGLSVLGMLLFGLGLIYLVVPLALFPAFLAFDEELSAIEIVKSSFALGNKNWLVIFGLVILMGLLAELGIILCCVGVLFTAMLSKVPIYYIYKDGIGFSEKE
jgi:hypothetical protein